MGLLPELLLHAQYEFQLILQKIENFQIIRNWRVLGFVHK